MKIEYPTKEKRGDLTEDEKEAIAAKYFGHNNNLGFYPVGRLNTWHGGIHIEGENKEIKAIADGRIIAYRMSEDYCSVKNDSDAKYSNSFVLMQHNYISPKEQKFRFYSLYMHLMPKNDMEIKKMIPEIFIHYTGKVIGEECMHGLNARSATEIETGKDCGVVELVIPVGAIVEIDLLPTEPSYNEIFMADPLAYRDEMVPLLYKTPLPFDIEKKKYWVAKKKMQDAIDNQWSNKASVKKYRYTRVKYGEYTDIYIATTSGCVKKAGENKLQIISCADSDKDAPKGVVVYDKPNNTGQGKYLRTEIKNTDLGELKKVNEQWFKIPGKEEYVFKNALDITETVDDKFIPNEIQNVDIEIKAGTTLGCSGIYAIKNKANYSAVHLEVFTDDSAIKDFINNKIGDDNRNQYEIPIGKPLKIGKPINNLKKDTSVIIYKYKGEYAQIGFEDVELLVKFTNLVDNNSTYSIKEEAIREVNKSCKYQFTTKDILTPQEKRYRDKDDNVVAFVNATHRKLWLKNKRAGQKFWVKSNAVPDADVLQPMQSMQAIGVNGLQTGTQGITTQTTSPQNAQADNKKFEPCWVKLIADIEEIYDIEPDNKNTADITIEEIIQVKRKLATSIDNNGSEWEKIKGQYFEDSIKKTTEGWIKKSEQTVINPYNWIEFGWHLEEETGNQYIYQFDANEKEKPHDFINTIWELVDLPKKVKQADGTYKEIPGDKVLSQFELQKAMRNEHKVNILSKLICKHHSEWDTWKNINAFENEVKELYQQGIDQEDYPEEKQQLEQARDERILQLKEKVENLCFWQDVKDGDIGTPKEGAEPRKFPEDSNVYHFHPIAFIEQMKMITAPTMPPWMEIAIEKAVMAGGAHESQEPLYSFAKKCLELGGSNASPDDNDKGQWCGAFVSWCLNETNYEVAPNKWERLRSQSFVSLEGKIYKKIDTPVVGCIVVMTNYNKTDGSSKESGHVTMLYSIDGNNLVCLGGNQGSALKFSNYKYQGISYNGNKFEQRFNSFLMPVAYPESYYNFNIPTITVDEANRKHGINLKSNKNESTF